jgi:predicted transcriptional regulator
MSKKKLKIKKYYFNVFWNEKHFESNHYHTPKHPQTSTNSNQFSKQQNPTTIQDLQQKLKKIKEELKQLQHNQNETQLKLF